MKMLPTHYHVRIRTCHEPCKAHFDRVNVAVILLIFVPFFVGLVVGWLL